nr:hypothetical protein [Tanacetum cinerariifolium]
MLPVYYDDDDDEERSNSLEVNIISGLPLCSAIIPNEPILSIEEPDNSLSMGDEHIDTISATESDEFIKSSVENLIPIPSESEGIPEHMCDVPFHDNSQPLDASPPDYELVSSEVMEIVIPKVGGIDDDIRLTINDYILHEILLNVNHLFAKIEALNDNPTPFYDPIISGTPPTLTPSGEKGDILLLETFLNEDHSSDFKTKSSSTSFNYLLEETNTFDNSLPESDTLCFDVEEISSGSTTTRSAISLPEYEASYDDQSFSDKDHYYNAESDLMESLRTHDSSLLISSKIDSLLDEFVGELALLKSIPPGIDGTDCDFKEDVRFIDKLLYDNSSPRPPKEFVSANSDAEIESFSPFPILVKDSDSLMKEIDLSCTLNYPMPSGIEDNDYDSERDILILKDLHKNDTLLIPKIESFHFDIPSFSRPPAKPPDGNTGILNIKMMGDISDQKAFMHKLMITLAPHQEKYPDLLSHRGLKAFQPFGTCPMMIHGKNIPILDVLLFHFYLP